MLNIDHTGNLIAELQRELAQLRSEHKTYRRLALLGWARVSLLQNNSNSTPEELQDSLAKLDLVSSMIQENPSFRSSDILPFKL